MTVGLIWAQAANRVIGVNGSLPWHLPEDMAHFRRVTSGATVVMGRATWQSLPERFRPLPDRVNVVLSRDPSYDALGATVAGSLEQALAHDGDVWVIGGAAVYAAAIEHADRVAVTELADSFDGDTYAPAIDETWQEISRDPQTGWHTSTTGLRFRWRELRRGP